MWRELSKWGKVTATRTSQYACDNDNTADLNYERKQSRLCVNNFRAFHFQTPNLNFESSGDTASNIE